MLLTWFMYYVAGPWVFFKGWTQGNEDGCEIKYFLFVPITVYAEGF